MGSQSLTCGVVWTFVTVCLLLKGVQADKIKDVKNRLLDETNLSFEIVCAKISSPAQCEYPVKLKGDLAINSLGLSGGKPLKAEKRKARKNEGGQFNGQPIDNHP